MNLHPRDAMLKWLQRLRPALPDLRDLHVYGGGVLLATGAWMAWPPAAPIVAGALLIYLGMRV